MHFTLILFTAQNIISFKVYNKKPHAQTISQDFGGGNLICLYDGHSDVTSSSMFLDPHNPKAGVKVGGILDKHPTAIVKLYETVEGLIFMRWAQCLLEYSQKVYVISQLSSNVK